MVPQDPAGPADSGAPSGRKWRWIGLAVVVVAAVVLFGATLWVSQGGGGPLAGATGASTPTQVPAPAGVEPVAETPVPTEPAVDESEAPGEEPVPEAPVEPESEPESTDPPVDAAPLPELPPVPLTEQVAPVPGVVVSISGLEAVEGEAQGPGEVAGPALRFTLSMRNDGDAPVSLTSTVVTVYSGPEQTPAVDLRGPGGVPLPEEVAPGATVTGVFIFTVPPEERDQVKIGVDYTVGVPIVVFEGSAPR
ncbi:hypothetical protein K2F54_05735 [Cryobacterium sp. 1639]|uniref:hypothetical protein n=1 Tax=Cryobacterium inferilacus TaxID=2866629 RepID=UPI001C730213|nr:hypothetical protein [Cryobacterium sp. 1639]MBX0299474.1 hypothetical protein [Cryobacterium sp. 1639]